MDERMEREYRDALDALRFSDERKEQMMKNKNTLIVGILFALVGLGLLVAGTLIPYLLTLGAALIVTGIIMIFKGLRQDK